MKRAVVGLVSLALAGILHAQTIHLNSGWTLVGSSSAVDIPRYFALNGVEVIWRWNGQTWEGFSPNPELNSKMIEAGFRTFSMSNPYEGFWVLCSKELDVNLPDVASDSTAATEGEFYSDQDAGSVDLSDDETDTGEPEGTTVSDQKVYSADDIFQFLAQKKNIAYSLFSLDEIANKSFYIDGQLVTFDANGNAKVMVEADGNFPAYEMEIVFNNGKLSVKTPFENFEVVKYKADTNGFLVLVAPVCTSYPYVQIREMVTSLNPEDMSTLVPYVAYNVNNGTVLNLDESVQIVDGAAVFSTNMCEEGDTNCWQEEAKYQRVGTIADFDLIQEEHTYTERMKDENLIGKTWYDINIEQYFWIGSNSYEEGNYSTTYTIVNDTTLQLTHTDCHLECGEMKCEAFIETVALDPAGGYIIRQGTWKGVEVYAKEPFFLDLYEMTIDSTEESESSMDATVGAGDIAFKVISPLPVKIKEFFSYKRLF